jgi:GNAT superfamily N-acetyltransferase
MLSTLRIERFSGPSLYPYLPELAKLRIAVFREFPYLYEGSLDYEQKYLRTYADSAESVIVIAFDGEQVVGASTALPLEHEPTFVQAPFVAQGRDPRQYFYLGESVLLPRYRGQGAGVRFFEEREAHAEELGRFAWAAFCAVERPANHPRRPKDYLPLDAFWHRRGYTKHPELVTEFTWQDLDESAPSPKPMVFWLKPLD